MKSPHNQSWQGRLARKTLGRRTYALARALKLIFPLTRGSFSQENEDVTLAEVFGPGPGTYLDIGSGHPIHLSNTYLFYKLGWSGVCVDPIGVNLALARILRRRDRNLRALISQRSGSNILYEMDPSFYSTTDIQVAERCINEGATLVRRSHIPTVPVSQLNFRPRPDQPSFMSIDVEGDELQVLESIDWRYQRTWGILIELWDRQERVEKNRTIRDFLANHGYHELEQIGSQNFLFLDETLLSRGLPLQKP